MIQDKTAIVGIGQVPYRRTGAMPSTIGMAVEASRRAITDAGLNANDIDGICGSSATFFEVQMALGIPATNWGLNTGPAIPFVFQLIEAMHAVRAGACRAVLVYHTMRRFPGASEKDVDPLRVAAMREYSPLQAPDILSMARGGIGYAAWANRYLHEFNASREDLGQLVINNRSNAVLNPNAAFRTPLTMDQYLAGRMVRDPLCIFDMDVMVDGADAVVITRTDHARTLRDDPILIHAASAARTGHAREDQIEDLHHTGQELVAPQLWNDSALSLGQMDIVYAYDGFSIIQLMWLEALGFCKRGEGASFVREHWNSEQMRILIGGRVPVNTNGGQLSEGASQGSGAVREAVHQLRGQAGERQVQGARAAVLTLGGFIWNAGAIILRRD